MKSPGLKKKKDASLQIKEDFELMSKKTIFPWKMISIISRTVKSL